MRAAVYAFTAIMLLALPGAGQEKEKRYYTVQHPTGTKAGMLKEPDFSKAVDLLIGTVKNGTKVEFLESAKDKNIPAIGWYKVTVLDGDLKGTDGWISVSNLKEVPAAASATDDKKAVDRKDSKNKPKEADPNYTLKEARLFLSEPDFTRATETSLHVGSAPAGTLLRALDDQPKKDGVGVTWRRVAILSGDLKGKEGWVSELAIAKAFIITGDRKSNDFKGWGALAEDGSFNPEKTDTLFGDRQKSEGKLSDEEHKKLESVMSEFLRGKAAANAAMGHPSDDEVTGIINPMIKKFLAAEGGKLLHEKKDPLVELVKESGQYKHFRIKMVTELKKQVQEQIDKKGKIDLGEIDVRKFFLDPKDQVQYPKYWDRLTPFTLRAVLGGIQAMKVVAKNPSATVEEKSGGGGTVELKFTMVLGLYDVFGAEDEDRKGPVEAMWQLQRRGTARPFNNHILVESDFKELFDIPAEYKEVINRLKPDEKPSK